ncbi:hypothetical protein ELQ35_00515 [Peribacillus cavernae]|uniref:Lipoprotein n=1 Tax=Peribacillus cavernae TaxID=1674310 RepID=A0A3S0WCS7_9BACI|nr:PCYCGC motif-containing (lipo)protein [Peribacillus cavernae]MDQ0217968.1 hypothetical protein [Peribacillus cavernae]RUQ32613.1 hypothetical protein ELQ35_00515 [Peribacillus cavernae]
MKRKYTIFGSIILSASLFLAGCGNEPSSKSDKKEDTHSDSHQQHAGNGDIREETKSADSLPHFLKGKPEDMTAIYAASAKHQELLESIPCYCGCSESAAHRNNYDCFIHENKKNGAIVWDDHGTKCEVCLVIAAESINQKNEGKSLEEIRQYIDDKYKEGYAEPTPTPMPKG